MNDHLTRRLHELRAQLDFHLDEVTKIEDEAAEIEAVLYPPPPRRWVPRVLKGGAAAAALWVATKAKDRVAYVAGAGALAGTAAILLMIPFGDDVNQPEVPSVIGSPTHRPTVGPDAPAPLATLGPTVAPTVGLGPTATPEPASVAVTTPSESSPQASPGSEPSAPPTGPEPGPPSLPSPEPPPGPTEPPQGPPEPTPTPEPPAPSPSPSPSPTAEPPSPPPGGVEHLVCIDADLSILELELCLLELGQGS